MMQQVNLYKLLPKKAKFALTRQMVLAAYSIFLLLLIFVYGVEVRHKQQLAQQYTQLDTQGTALQQQLALLTQKYPIRDIVALKKNISELQEKLKSKANILNLLTSKTQFSNYLLGLASVYVQGAWLAEIKFDNAEQAIELKGFALQSNLVDELVSQLSKGPAFLTAKFEINNIAEHTKPIGFEIIAKTEAKA